MSKYQEVVQQAPDPEGRGFLYQREAGIFVPLGQALVTGFLAFILVFMIVWLITDFAMILDGWKVAGGLAVVVGTIVCFLQWRYGLRHWAYNADLNTALVVPVEPDAPITKSKHMIELDIVRKDKDGYKRSTASFPLSDALMVQVTLVLLSGRGFSERGMTGKGSLLTPKQWEAVIDTLEENGIIELVNTEAAQQGYQLTEEGYEIMTKWLKQMGVNPPPPPEKKSRRARA
jgi:hypothetical protein